MFRSNKAPLKLFPAFEENDKDGGYCDLDEAVEHRLKRQKKNRKSSNSILYLRFINHLRKYSFVVAYDFIKNKNYTFKSY